jgi:uncharacterized protein YaaR (DUF327 family)
MTNANIVYKYESLRRTATKLKLTLTTIESPIDNYKYFAVGPRKYGTIKAITDKLREHHQDCTQKKCPIKIFENLEEVNGFIIGFAMASKQNI